jgi:hypothetical protein
MKKYFENVHFPAGLKHLAVLGLLVVSLAIIYSNSFQAPFLFDDLENIVEKTSMQLTVITYKSLHRAAFEGLVAKRWVPNLSFALNYYWGGHEVWGYHLFNLVVHMMTAMVLYGLFFTTLTLPKSGCRPGQAGEIALIAALVWAVHPLQTNAVTYIVQRMTSLAALFYLAALLCYVRGRLHSRLTGRRYVFWTAAFLSGFLAIASKENSVMLPLLILAYEVYFLRDREWRSKSWRGFAVMGVSLLSVVSIVWFYIGRSSLLSIFRIYQFRDFTLWERLLTETRVIFHYLSLIVLPLPSRLNLNYDFPVSRSMLSPPLTLVTVLGIIVLLWLVIFLFRRHRLLSFGLLWFLANLAVESTIIPLELVFEHRLYLPASMLILAMVALVFQLGGGREKLVRPAWAAVIVILCFFTWQRNLVWTTEISLWRDVVRKSPNLARGYSYLGRAYNIQERYQESFALFEQAAGQEFDDVNVFNNWGKAAFQLGKIERSVELLERAVRLDSNHPESHYNLGVAYGSQGRVAEARREMILGMNLQQAQKR